MIVRAKIDGKAMEAGHRRHRGKCAIAYAIAAAYPDYRHINVDREQIRFSDIYDRTRYCFATPSKLAKFIDDWDKGTVPDNPPSVDLRDDSLKWVKAMKGRTASDMVGQRNNPDYKSYTGSYVAEQKIDIDTRNTDQSASVASSAPAPTRTAPKVSGRRVTERELVGADAS